MAGIKPILEMKILRSERYLLKVMWLINVEASSIPLTVNSVNPLSSTSCSAINKEHQ